jgi:hypothetical protein
MRVAAASAVSSQLPSVLQRRAGQTRSVSDTLLLTSHPPKRADNHGAAAFSPRLSHLSNTWRAWPASEEGGSQEGRRCVGRRKRRVP